jgi:hypothetical protein
LFGSDNKYCVTSECPQLIDKHLLCDPKQQFTMASAEEKWKGESRDQQVKGKLNSKAQLLILRFNCFRPAPSCDIPAGVKTAGKAQHAAALYTELVSLRATDKRQGEGTSV